MSFVAPEYHVLSEAAKDARVNGGSVSVNHAILRELLAVWRASQPQEPTPAAPIADQIAIGSNPVQPIDSPPNTTVIPVSSLEQAPPAAPVTTEPAPDDAPPVTPKVEPTIQ